MPRIFRTYNDLLKKYPFRINMLTSSIFFGAGDICAQTVMYYSGDKDLDEHPHEFTFGRTVRAMVYGGFFFGPLLVCWQIKTLPYFKSPFVSAIRRRQMQQDGHSTPRLHLYDTMWRVFIDQLFIPGLVWIPLYNTVMLVLAGNPHPFEASRDKLKLNWWRVLTASWTVWPAFQLANLFFLPVHWRIVAANVWLVGWNAFLSYVHNGKSRGKGNDHKFYVTVDDTNEVVMTYN